MILDAGCGNRCMWQQKTSDHIIYIDLEKQLQRKPDMFATNIALPFKSYSFDTIFFDPPFCWNAPVHPLFSFPNKELLLKKYPNRTGCLGSYYGIERYKTRGELTAYIYRAKQELARILKPDGVLWLRWCIMTNMTETNVLSIFSDDFNVMLTHEIGSKKRSTGETASYWFMLMKKPKTFNQLTL